MAIAYLLLYQLIRFVKDVIVFKAAKRVLIRRHKKTVCFVFEVLTRKQRSTYKKLHNNYNYAHSLVLYNFILILHSLK